MHDPDQRLGKLEKVELRDVWSGEATEFTPWLATYRKGQPRLARRYRWAWSWYWKRKRRMLGHTVLTSFARTRQMTVGSSLRTSLEKTNHSHLGQILTYAAGLSAVTVVWIAKRFTDEHRAALDWLNEISSDSAQFFGLEIEVWKIGEDRGPHQSSISWQNRTSGQIVRNIVPKSIRRPRGFNSTFGLVSAISSWTKRRQSSLVNPLAATSLCTFQSRSIQTWHKPLCRGAP